MGDRECPSCEEESLVEKGLNSWECLNGCGIFDTEFLDDGEGGEE